MIAVASHNSGEDGMLDSGPARAREGSRAALQELAAERITKSTGVSVLGEEKEGTAKRLCFASRTFFWGGGGGEKVTGRGRNLGFLGEGFGTDSVRIEV